MGRVFDGWARSGRYFEEFQPGDTICAETEVPAVRERESKPGGGVVSVETCAVNQRGEPVLSFRRRVLAPGRPEARDDGEAGA